MKDLKRLLPDYPRTLHLPYKPNAVRDDLVATEKEAEVIFNSSSVVVEEKVDGANCAMLLLDGNAVIRNRNHILSKGYRKLTPAKMQFTYIWNWFYSNREKFEKVNELMGYEAGVYGEWMYAVHGIEYSKLPNHFLTYDIYDPFKGNWVESKKARAVLVQAGFDVVPLLHYGAVSTYENLESFCNQSSVYSESQREGVYVKVSTDGYISHRFKMVRQGFVQGGLWDERKIKKQKLSV